MQGLTTGTKDYNIDISSDLKETNFTVLPYYDSSHRSLTCEEFREGLLNFPPRVWLLIIICLHFLIGVFGNGILVLLFLLDRNLRTVNNALLVNLVFSDFLFVLVHAPNLIFEELYRLRPFGKTFCVISYIVYYTSINASTMSMSGLSYLRYRAVMSDVPLRRDDQNMKRFIVILCGTSWLVGIAAAIYPAMYCEGVSHECLHWDRHFVDSFTDNTNHLIFHIVRFVSFYLLPLLIIASFYSMMAFKLCRPPSSLQGNNSYSAIRATRSRKKLGGIVLAIVVIFFVSWLPNYLLWFTGLDDTEFIPWLLSMRKACMFLPASLNPALLLVASSKYRGSLRQTFSPPKSHCGGHFVRRLRISSSNVVSIRLTRLGNLL